MPDGGGSARRRVAVVTGGGGGIGSEACFELARQGVAVIAMDPGVGLEGEPLHEPTAEAVAEKIRASGGTARSSQASVTDRNAVRELFGDVVTEFGSLDIVLNTGPTSVQLVPGTLAEVKHPSPPTFLRQDRRRHPPPFQPVPQGTRRRPLARARLSLPAGCAAQGRGPC